MSNKNLQKHKKVFKPFAVIAERVGQVLGVKDLKQAHMAREFGISRQSIKNYEEQNYFPTDTIVAFCVSRKVSLDWMRTGRGAMEIDKNALPGNVIYPDEIAIKEALEMIRNLSSEISVLREKVKKLEKRKD